MSSHDGVYTRLARSPIHGIGVFVIQPIPCGTLLFTAGGSGLVSTITSERLSGLPAEIQKLYKDFAVHDSTLGTWTGPESFDDMGVAWYINHNKFPNVQISPDWEYLAIRDILVGEELTADYDSYSPMVIS